MAESVSYETDGRIAYVTLDRPERYNAISAGMPGAIEEAVARANADEDVHVVVLQGAGDAFCAGYDLKETAEDASSDATREMPWDPTLDYRAMKSNTESFMSLWHSYKPTICAVQGYAIAGGSDLALCADIVVMAEDAEIGYPPARVWGCPTTAMWVYRVGAERAKRMLLTGDLIDGRAAADMGLVYESVPADELDASVRSLAERMAGVPRNQLVLQKLMVNQAYQNMGLETTQLVATLFDGIARHTPEGVAFKERAEAVGFKQAVAERDSGQPLEDLLLDDADDRG